MCLKTAIPFTLLFALGPTTSALVLSDVRDDSVRIGWTSKCSRSNSTFEMYMIKEGQGDFKLIKTVPGNISNIVAHGLEEGCRYKFKLWTVKSGGKRHCSGESEWIATTQKEGGKFKLLMVTKSIDILRSVQG